MDLLLVQVLDDEGHAVRLLLIKVREKMLLQVMGDLVDLLGHLVNIGINRAGVGLSVGVLGVAATLLGQAFVQAREEQVHRLEHALLVGVIFLVLLLLDDAGRGRAVGSAIIGPGGCIRRRCHIYRSRWASVPIVVINIVLFVVVLNRPTVLQAGLLLLQGRPDELVLGGAVGLENGPDDLEAPGDAALNDRDSVDGGGGTGTVGTGIISVAVIILLLGRRSLLLLGEGGAQVVHVALESTEGAPEAVMQMDDLDEGAVPELGPPPPPLVGLLDRLLLQGQGHVGVA